MTTIEFVNFFAFLIIAFVVIRSVEIWGPSWISTPVGALFHA